MIAAEATRLDSHWLPFTPNRDFLQEPKLFAKAAGVHYYTPDGREVLDAGSGLFTTPAGHGRREIADAVRAQLVELDYASSFQRGHPAAFALADRIAALTPTGLDRIFFCSSGSEAVETAMKMALAYHRNLGQGSRTLFVSRDRAYHGVNFGGTALSGIVANRRGFTQALPAAVHMRHTWLPENRFCEGEGEFGADLADDLERLARLHGAENIAACFVEPIAGSTGVLVPPRGYLTRLREICDRHGILLVFDEVITGFGRAGAAFASQAFGVTPDLITMAKAITNGALPMAAVAASRKVYDAVVTASPLPRSSSEFAHGYTWSAHPAACAAALAALDIYDREDLFPRAAQMSAYFLEGLFDLRDIGVVADIRGFGLLGGLDLEASSVTGERGHALQKRLYDNGLHLKTTADSAILAPPFVMSHEQFDQMFEVLRKTLKTF